MANEKKNMPPIMGPRGRGRFSMQREKPKDYKKTLGRLIDYIAGNKHLFFSLIGIMGMITLLNLAVPAIQGSAIDMVTITDKRLNVDFNGFVRMLALLGVVYIASSVFAYLQGIFSAKLSQMTVRDLRHDLFSKIVRLPIRYFDTHQHGDIMSRMTNDVENVSNTISQSIGSLISGVLTVLGTVIIMLCYSPILTLVSMVTVVLTVAVTGFLSKQMRKLFSRQQVVLGELNGHAEESVTGYRTISAFGKEEKQVESFRALSSQLRGIAIRAQILGGSMGPVMNMISNTGFLLIAGFGGYMAWNGVITIGTIQAFLIYAKQFSRPISELANQFAQIQTAIAGAERVFDIMDSEPEPDKGTSSIDDLKGDVEFENVDFSYVEGEQVLKNFNLHVRSGQKIALVGATGSGKTTVVNLLTRFYDIDSGTIKIDGIDIRDIPKNELRESIAIVLQDTVLFSDTVGNNIRYGRLDASEEEIRSAAASANADAFIERLKEGYSTKLNETGSNISQGQRQLLSIARAVLKNPKILILDEATSSVDTRTEMHIQQAMIALMKNRTSIIIAHRLSTIRDADLIVVLKKGQIAETGDHDGLLAKKGCYYKLYQSQFAGNAT